MNRKGKMMALLIAAVMLVALAPLAAQSSSTNTATAGVFTTDADKFMEPADYSTLDMDKSLFFAEYNENLGLGFAKKLGSLYLGTYYTGNVLRLDNPSDSIEVMTTDALLDGQLAGTTTETVHSTNSSFKNTYNNFSVLIGLANMGFELGVWENFRFSDKMDENNDRKSENTRDGSKVVSSEYTDISLVQGRLSPSLDWGMRLPVGNMTLKPQVSLNAAFDLSSEEYTNTTYTEAFGVKTTQAVAVTKNALGSMSPSAYIGLAIESTGKKGSKNEFYVGYMGEKPIYSNEYTNAFGVKETVDGTAESKTTTSSTTGVDGNGSFNETKVDVSGSVKEITEFNNFGHIGFKTNKDFNEKVAYGFSARIAVNYGTSTEVDTWKSTKKISQTYDSPSVAGNNNYVQEDTYSNSPRTTKTTILQVIPTIATGLKFQAIPGVLSFNAGVSVDVSPFVRSLQTITKDSFEQQKTVRTFSNGQVQNWMWVSDNATREEAQNLQYDWDVYNASAAAGLTLTVTPNVVVDTALTSGNGLTLSCTIKK